MLFSAVLAHQSYAAEQTCEKPVQSFRDFLSRFRIDKSFNESRVVFPLQVEFFSADGPITSRLSLGEYKSSGMAHRLKNTIKVKKHVRASAVPLTNKNGEFSACELPHLFSKEGVAVQIFTCGEPAFGASYDFALVKGCWYLKSFSPTGN